MTGRTRAPEELVAAACPVLIIIIIIIVGDEDILMPPFAAVMPAASSVHIADAGHSVYFGCPRLFNRHAATFLERGPMGQP